MTPSTRLMVEELSKLAKQGLGYREAAWVLDTRPRYVANLAKLNPDLLAFTGDQFYESSGGYGIIRTPTPPAMIDYLRKWYLHGWTWRDLTRDRPSVSLPDDHDVYQGNLWGEGGSAQGPTQESGGYTMDGEWVKVVYRTQTAHHHAQPMLPGEFHRQPGVASDFHIGNVVQHLAGEIDTLFQREQRGLAGIGGDGDHDAVENAGGPTHQVIVAVGDRIESAGIHGAGHGNPHRVAAVARSR